LKLRRSEPRLARPFKAWWYPWGTVCALAVSVGFLIAAVVADLRHCLFTIVLVCLSYAAARLIVRTPGTQKSP
jgi:APA family basic amino acid/polyamine antiporter